MAEHSEIGFRKVVADERKNLIEEFSKFTLEELQSQARRSRIKVEGDWETLLDRLVRFDLRRLFKASAADWDEAKDSGSTRGPDRSSLNPNDSLLAETNLSFDQSLSENQGDREAAGGTNLTDPEQTLNVPPTFSTAEEILHSTVVDSNRDGTSPSTGTLPKPPRSRTGLPQISEEITIPSCSVLTDSQITINSSITNPTSLPTTQMSSRSREAHNQRIDFSNLNFPNPQTKLGMLRYPE